IQRLLEKGQPAAIHDSLARAYPPLCHPDTRRSLRNRIRDWGRGDESDKRMLWVLGPAAVGKSAVAQAIAEEFQEAGRLGASLFFSRPNYLDDPDWVIPTLVLQLAIKHPQYKHIVTQCLVNNLLILTKNRRTQFRELVIEPFRTLMTQSPHTVQEPLLIIIDGLDECKDKQAQCEFIEFISTHVRQVDKFPLRWMICSRPEWHLTTMLSNPDFGINCQREELRIDDSAAKRDAHFLLVAEFDKIRKKYQDRLPAHWPPEHQCQRIAFIASGHLGFASFILRFIEDEEYDDPDGQLQVCMKFLDGGSSSIGAINPLHTLDLLYHRILSDVPANHLPITMAILGLMIGGSGFCSADDQARFLNLNSTTFRRSLQHLHSVVYVPPISESNATSLRIYHASFSDFLTDSTRSGKFYLNREAAKYDFILRCLHWINNGGKKAIYIAPVLVTNPCTFQDGSSSNEAMIKISAANGWNACYGLSSDFFPVLLGQLECFNFGRLKRAHFMTDDAEFATFLSWLYSLVS
ncbi:hypothetical protein P691DRAFT_659278, partial [Macrolepiota fuliginosa MF-IS2]